MKVAKARYTGTMRSKFHRGPSGEEYKFKNPENNPRWIPIESIRDAEEFERLTDYDVEWTSIGRAVSGVDEPLSGVDAMLEEWGYRTKQRIAKKLGIKANKPEDELEEAIKPEVEQLAEQMERYNT